jgi:cytochrome c-type biogenesis protein CcmF
LTAAISLGLFSLAALAVNITRLVEVRRNWKLIGGFLTHIGVGLMLIGIIFSNRGTTTALLLPEKGEAMESHGYKFQYLGLDQKTADKAYLKIKVWKDGESFIARPSMQRTRDGMMRSPYIKVKPLGDLYIAPEELRMMGQSNVTPSIVIDQKGNRTSPPVKIPGTDVELKLLGMQVEGRLAQLQVVQPGREPDVVQVQEGNPIVVGGRQLEFGGFSAPKGHGIAGAAFGVNINVLDPTSRTAARVKVSNKPLISVLWAGVILVLFGGTIAIFRRTKENRKILKARAEDPEGSR